MKKGSRAALVTNVLAHYRVPCFEALATRLPGQIDFYLLAGEMAHRSYVMAGAGNMRKLPLHVLPGKGFARPPYDDIHLNDPRPVLRDHTCIVLSGWAEPSYLLLWALARASGKRIGFWIESTAEDLRRVGWKESTKRALLARASVIVTAGTSATRYCEGLGVPREKIFCAPNAINVEYFQKQARALLPKRVELRAELNLTGTVILFVGRMVDALKNVSTLLAAQGELEGQYPGAQLVLVGEGPDRARYEAMVHERKLRNVRFVNFLEHDALCRYYAAADIFVLPSRSEPWGFVLNEAMEFGLPLVVSNVVGAAPDLVMPGENGYVAPVGDAGALAKALEELVRDPALRARMGARSREIIARFTPEAWAEGFARGLEAMME